MAKRQRSKGTEQPAEPSGPPQWLQLSYEPVSLFSLRTTFSTNKGGKTLLLPSPYAVKLALVDAAFRRASSDGTVDARRVFNLVKRRRIRFRPPQECVVQHTFVRICQDFDPGDKKKGMSDADYANTLRAKLREAKPTIPEKSLLTMDVKSLKKAFGGLFSRTIAFREMCFYRGTLTIAIDAAGWTQEDAESLLDVALHVNYFGKRGSFFQFVGSEMSPDLPEAMTIAEGDGVTAIPFGQYGVTQFLDDFGPDLCKAKDGFERISTFHDGRIENGKHRLQVSTLVPYRRVEATRSFTRYTSSPPHSS